LSTYNKMNDTKNILFCPRTLMFIIKNVTDYDYAFIYHLRVYTGWS